VEKLQSLRGMVDLLPDHTPLWQHIEATARRHFQRAVVREIRTPLLEATELFARGIGEATDVVGKEMYTFTDRGDRSCTLRPEGTASVVRAAIQHGLLSQGPQRLWYGGPMFRYERPQAGRQRQFHQIGLECLGFADARSDVEAIAIAWDLLAELGVGGLALEINTLGSTEDRARYRERLVAFLEQHRDGLDPDSQDRLRRNPLRILDSKNATTQALLADAPTLAEALAATPPSRSPPASWAPRPPSAVAAATTAWWSSWAGRPRRQSAGRWAWSAWCCCWLRGGRHQRWRGRRSMW